MCGKVVAYVDGWEGGPCVVQMGMRWVAGEWVEIHGSILGVRCGVFQST